MRNIRVADRRDWVTVTAATSRAGATSRRSARLRDWLATIPIAALVVLSLLPLAGAMASGPTLVADPSTAEPGATITVTGSGFSKGTTGSIVLDGGKAVGVFKSVGNGGIRTKVVIPATAPAGAHRLDVLSGGAVLASATVTVAEPAPTATPTAAPTATSTAAPTATPTAAPTDTPTAAPTATPTPAPTSTPSASPAPTATPTSTPSTPAGSGYYVATTGSDTNSGTLSAPWRTLQKAASTAPAGSTVYLRGGTYAGFNMTRSGTASAWIAFQPYATEAVTVAGDASRSKVIDVNAAHYVRIRGLTVTGAPNQWGAGIFVENGSSSIEILDNVAIGNRSFGIKVASSTNVLIRGNEITKNETGIEVSYGGSGVVIDSNHIHDNDRMVVNTIGGNDDRGANAVVLNHTAGPLSVSNNQMWNNRAVSYDYGYDGGAVEIYAASGATISGNRMWNNENVIETGTDGTACDGNSFVRNVAFGGTKTGPSMGLILRCASNMVVANNTFDGLDRFVFDITASASAFGGSIDGLTIRNNVAYTTADKIYSIDSALPSSVTLDWDLAFHATGGSIAYVYGHGNTPSMATFRTWTGFESHGVQADPRFASRLTSDFTTQSTSPAIDDASLFAPITDGYSGAAPDMGRYEHP